MGGIKFILRGSILITLAIIGIINISACGSPGITELNSQAKSGEPYDNAQKVVDAINAGEVACEQGAAAQVHPDTAACLVQKEDEKVMVNIYCASIENETPSYGLTDPVLQLKQQEYLEEIKAKYPEHAKKTIDSYIESYKTTKNQFGGEDDSIILVGPTWVVQSDEEVLKDIQTTIGGELQDISGG